MSQYLFYLLNLYSQGIFSIQSLTKIIFIHSEFDPSNIFIENEEISDSLMNQLDRLSNDKSDLLNYSNIYSSEEDIQRSITKIFWINSFQGLIQENIRYQKLKEYLINWSLFPYDFLIVIKYDFHLEEFNFLLQQLENDISDAENSIDWESVRKQIVFILDWIWW